MKYKKMPILITCIAAVHIAASNILLHRQAVFSEKLVFRQSGSILSHGKMYKRYTFEGSAPFGSELAGVGWG